MKELHAVVGRRLVALIISCLAIFIVKSAWAQPLGVRVAGIEVTKSNAKDLMKAIGASQGTGKMSYDIASRTLTLENVRLTLGGTTHAIESTSSLTDFSIELKGQNEIQLRSGRLDLAAPKNIIKGTGSLVCVSQGAATIFLDDSELTIADGCTVDVTGMWGIAGYAGYTETLIVQKGATLKAKGNDGSIKDLKEIRLEEGVSITAPLNAKIVGGNVVVEKEGVTSVCTEQVVIETVSTDYDITVKGVKVTADNAANVLGDGSVVYLPESKTLCLKSAHIDADQEPALSLKSEIYIQFEGDNRLTSKGADALVASDDLVLKVLGDKAALLSLKSEKKAALKAMKNLTINGGQISAEGVHGVQGGGGLLSVISSKVETIGSEASLSDFSSITFKGCHIHEPKGCKITDGTVYMGGQICKEKILIDKTIEYLFVGGRMVTSENHSDVFGDGKVSYDVANRVLTLNNFVFKTETGESGVNISSLLADATIELLGHNEIETPYLGLGFSVDVVIRGTGSLTIKSESSAIALSGATLTIEPGVTLDLQSPEQGIMGFSEYPGQVIFKKANVKINGKKGAIVRCSQILFEDCGVVSPEGVEVEGGNLVLNHEICTVPVVISPKGKMGLDALESSVNIRVETAKGMLAIAVDTPTLIRIHTMDGTLVADSFVSQTASFALPEGGYILQIGSSVQKVMIP